MYLFCCIHFVLDLKYAILFRSILAHSITHFVFSMYRVRCSKSKMYSLKMSRPSEAHGSLNLIKVMPQASEQKCAGKRRAAFPNGAIWGCLIWQWQHLYYIIRWHFFGDFIFLPFLNANFCERIRTLSYLRSRTRASPHACDYIAIDLLWENTTSFVAHYENPIRNAMIKSRKSEPTKCETGKSIFVVCAKWQWILAH